MSETTGILGMEPMSGCSRESARTYLLSQARFLREKSRSYEILADAIGDLSSEAEEALWKLVRDATRNY